MSNTEGVEYLIILIMVLLTFLVSPQGNSIESNAILSTNGTL